MPSTCQAGQVAANPGLDRAEILADRERVSPGRLPRQRADREPVVVAYVRPPVGRHAFWDPPQPHQAHDMIHAHAARVPERGAEELSERRCPRRGYALRMPRRLRPVLASLVEAVRGSADRHAAHQQVLVRPGVRSAGMHADGQVPDHADAHSCGAGRPLRLGELLVEQPLDPRVEAGPIAERPGFRSRGRTARTGQLRRPPPPVRPVPLGEGAPARPGVELCALAVDEPAVPRLPLSCQADRVDLLERQALGLPHLVPVNEVGGAAGRSQRPCELVDVLALRGVELVVLGDVLDPQVERAHIAAGHRQVGGIADRKGRLGGVQRVDQDEPGAELPARPAHQVREIVQVAVTPGAA